MVWQSHGFLVALLSTILNFLVLFAIFGAPEWFMLLSYRYAARAAEFEEGAATSAMLYEEDDVEDHNSVPQQADEPEHIDLLALTDPAVKPQIIFADARQPAGPAAWEERQAEASVRISLHEAIRQELMRHGRPMDSSELALAINRTGRYVRPDGQPVRASQVSARVRKYDGLFRRECKGGY